MLHTPPTSQCSGAEVARKLGHLPAATTPEMVLHHFGRMLNRRPPATTAQWLEEVAVEEAGPAMNVEVSFAYPVGNPPSLAEAPPMRKHRGGCLGL